MTQSENEVQSVDLSDPVVAAMVLGDVELRKIPVNSEEFQTVVNEKLAEKDAEASEATEVDKNDVVEENAKEAPLSKSKFRARLDELQKERDTERAQREALEAKIAEFEKRPVETKKEETKVEDKQPQLDLNRKFEEQVPKPKMSDFNSMEAYTEAMVTWGEQRVEFKQAVKEQDAARSTEVQTVANKWNENAKVAAEKYTDYESVVNIKAWEALKMSPEAAAVLARTDLGPEIAYNLLKDPEVAKKFASSDPIDQVVTATRTLTRIEGTLTPATPATKKAGDVPPKLAPRLTRVTTPDLNEINDFETYAKVRKAQRAK